MGGGALSSDYVSELGSKEVSKKLCNFTIAPLGRGIKGEGLKVEGKCARKSRKVAFTKPSRGTSEARDEQESTGTLSSRCDCERCRLMRGAVAQKSSKVAFTLAEVLITLGIIGVVAAMTLPTLIHKFQNKVLEVQFKKSLSIISQAILKTKTDMGVENLAQYCKVYDSDYVNANECYDYLYKNTLVMMHNKKPWNSSSANINRERDGEVIKTYNSKESITSINDLAGISYAIWHTNLMPDGTFLNYWIIEGALYIGIDINGKKGPNKLGHDIFVFILSENDQLTFWSKPKDLTDDEILDSSDKLWQQNRAGGPCSLVSKQKGNGIGCAWYALKDECPYDKTKRYFECLPR